MRSAIASVGAALLLFGCIIDGGGGGRRDDAADKCVRKAERNGFEVRDVISVDREGEHRFRVAMRVEKRNKFLRLTCTYNRKSDEAHLD